MKIDEILDDLDNEDYEMLKYLLKERDHQGSFLVGARRIADLVTEHTPHSVGVSAVLRWRRANCEENPSSEG